MLRFLVDFLGEYERPYTFGVQVESHIPSVPRLSLRTRKGWYKMYISAGHLRELVARDTPGVGSYNTTRSQASCGSRFGRVERPDRANFFPFSPVTTPGHEYAQTSSLCVSSSRKSSFPRSPRCLHRIEKLPGVGPGLYESSGFKGHLPGGSFGLSYASFRSMSVPGLNRERLGRGSWSVAGFNPRFASNAVSVSFARDRRHNWFDRISTANPVGPGAYDSSNKRDVSSPRFRPSSKVRPRLEFKKWRILRS